VCHCCTYKSRSLGRKEEELLFHFTQTNKLVVAAVGATIIRRRHFLLTTSTTLSSFHRHHRTTTTTTTTTTAAHEKTITVVSTTISRFDSIPFILPIMSPPPPPQPENEAANSQDTLKKVSICDNLNIVRFLSSRQQESRFFGRWWWSQKGSGRKETKHEIPVSCASTVTVPLQDLASRFFLTLLLLPKTPSPTLKFLFVYSVKLRRRPPQKNREERN
jgi:hypothetical protein